MALSVSGYNLVFNCNTAGMSDGSTESDTSVDGVGCLKLKVSNTTSNIITYDLGSGGVNYSGQHYGIYAFVAGAFDTKANGGVCLYAEDTSGNWYL